MKARNPHRRAGISTPFVVLAVVVIAALALGAVVLQTGGQSQSRVSTDMYTVARGDFDITIPASGELVALQQIEVRNRLESQATIMEIIDEGTTVKAGDLLVRLNDEEIQNRIKDAEDAFNNAESSLIASEANLEIRRSAAASELDRAKLAVELSILALKAWRDGEDLARREQLELAIETADINYNRLLDRYENSQRLFEQEFISADELRQDQISMIEAEARLRQAKRDQDVYLNYTYLQQQRQKNSDVEQAEAELLRVQQRHEAELETARADVASKRHQLTSRRERLEDLRTQLEYTVIRAPSDGLVVYASSMESHRRGNEDPPQVGTNLSRNELIMVLPDTSKMVAAVKINEALSGTIRRGQRARVTSDARPNSPMTGQVLNVGVLAESGGWRDPNRRDYTVRILLDSVNDINLRPSMRCRAEIFVDRVVDTLYVPVQSVHRVGRQAHVYVPVSGGEFEPRTITLGDASELYVQVRDGLSEGDRVLLREPQSHELSREAMREMQAARNRSGRDARIGVPAPDEVEPGSDDEAGETPAARQGQRPGAQRSGGNRPQQSSDASTEESDADESSEVVAADADASEPASDQPAAEPADAEQKPASEASDAS